MIKKLRMEMHHESNISIQTAEAASMSIFPTFSTSLMAASTFKERGGGASLQFVLPSPNFTILYFHYCASIQYLSCLLPHWNQDKTGVLLQCNMREVFSFKASQTYRQLLLGFLKIVLQRRTCFLRWSHNPLDGDPRSHQPATSKHESTVPGK